MLVPNDENAAPIIHYLQSLSVKPKTFPVTGQDATLVGLQNILAGYQCGTAYKPIYLEAQAAAALAMYLRAGEKPPAALANGSTDGHDQARSPFRRCWRRRSGLPRPTWTPRSSRTSSSRPSSCARVATLRDCKANNITP